VVATAPSHRGDHRGDSHPCHGSYCTHARAVARRDQGTATKAQIMKAFWVVVLSVWAFQAQAAVMETITQTTTGWCSPTVGHADGNVTITCQGVNPKALERLNELLDKKDLELQAKIREAEAWAQKYRELEQRLAAEGQDSPLAQQVQAFLKEGKLEEAGSLLDRLIEAEEKAVERVAAYHFNRAEVYTLQFQNGPLEAPWHYRKAYNYRPDNIEYAHCYAATLQAQRDFQPAEAIYQTNLATLRAMSTADLATFLPTLGRTLNNLGLLYNDTNRPLASEQACQEALRIQRQLAKSNAPTDLAGVAAALNNLGILYYNTQRWRESEDTYQEALQIWRQLAETNPGAYVSNVADTLVNLRVLHHLTQQWSKSEQAYQESLQIRQRLAVKNPAYGHSVAAALLGLWHLYSDMHRSHEAEEAYQEALRIERQLATNNSASSPQATERGGLAIAERQKSTSTTIEFVWAFEARIHRGDVAKLVSIKEHSTTLRTGDMLTMFVELRKPCFVYVLHHGAESEIQRLFPYDMQQFTTDYQTSKVYEIPPDGVGYTLNEQAGRETFYLLASAQRLVKLEMLLSASAIAPRATQLQLATSILTEISEIQKRYEQALALAPNLIPTPITGNMRSGIEGVEISAKNFYHATFIIEHE
jgi:hypothetical protein